MALITSDLKKTLKADKNPFITIDFVSFERAPGYVGKESIKCVLKIAMAGNQKTFDVGCSLHSQADGSYTLTGSHQFSFSDFSLKPPSRMLGAVKVKDEVTVKFSLDLKPDTQKN
jgi:hypothetical protein